MKLTIEGKELETIMQDAVFAKVGQFFGVQSKGDLEFDLDCRYDHLDKLTISTKEKETETEAAE